MEVRATTFSGEVLDLVVLSRVGVLSGEKQGLGYYLERSEDVDEVEGSSTTFPTEGRAFAVVAAFSVYLDKRDIGISD